MDKTRTNDIWHVSSEENNLVIAPYFEEELRKVVFQMEHNKFYDTNSFPADLY
jgi:hypothetical protein